METSKEANNEARKIADCYGGYCVFSRLHKEGDRNV